MEIETLSDKMKPAKNDDFSESGLFLKEDVREAVQRLKAILIRNENISLKDLKEIFGELTCS